jgi:hypothetical protein
VLLGKALLDSIDCFDLRWAQRVGIQGREISDLGAPRRAFRRGIGIAQNAG